MTARKAPLEGLDPEYVHSGARALWALVFVALVVVSLAVVPIVLGNRIEELTIEVSEVLQPSLEMNARLSLEQARQLSRFQAFLLTGDRAFRAQYMAAVSVEDSLYAELRNQVRVMDFDVRERLAALSVESARWHFEHQRAFDASEGPDADGTLQVESQTMYDELQRATRELDRAIRSEVDQARRDNTRLRRLQIWIAITLAVVALGTALVVARVGRRLRRLNLEAEQRRADAVRARREIDALLEATGEGVLGIDLGGACTSLNRAGSELLGYSEEEIRGRDVHETVHHAREGGALRARSESLILDALQNGGCADSGTADVLWRRNGTSFPARWSLRPLVDGVDVRGAVLTFADMTEIRTKEDALHRALDLREEVVSIVSHDLRNPLGVVAAAADILIELPLDEHERRQQAEIIARSADRMERLINDLLDVARIEAGAFVIRPSAEAVGPILREAKERLSDVAAHADVHVEVVCGDGVPAMRMDRDRILQALGNLLANAIRFAPAGSSVVLSAEPAGEGRAALVVSDGGPGIDPEALGHLFDRFWQCDGEGRGKAGLGLAIVRGIAEAHRGEVEVVSVPGEGATFRIILPQAMGPVVSGAGSS